MNFTTYARRNAFRRRGRTILTIAVIALTVLIFCLIRTILVSWDAGADFAAADRIATRHKNSITMQLPKRYIEDIRAIPEVKQATWAVWFGAKDPKERVPFFAGMAVDHESYFEVMDDLGLTPQELADWKATPNGAVLGDALAKKLQVKVGDRLVILSDIYPGEWELKVSGIYTALRKSADRNGLLFRWDYFNNDPRTERSHEQIGWVMSRIANSQQSAAVTRKIDKFFDEKDDQTMTQSERALQLSFQGGFVAILNAFKYISLAILLIMLLVLANSVAMSVRERTHEYGVLRAIGFQPKHVTIFIVGESLFIALLGGLIGAAISALLINGALGPAFEESGMFQVFRAPPSVLLTGLGSALLLGLVAAVLPAWGASKSEVTNALRRIA